MYCAVYVVRQVVPRILAAEVKMILRRCTRREEGRPIFPQGQLYHYRHCRLYDERNLRTFRPVYQLYGQFPQACPVRARDVYVEC